MNKYKYLSLTWLAGVVFTLISTSVLSDSRDPDVAVWIDAGWKWLAESGKSDVDQVRWLYNGLKQRHGPEWSIWVVSLAVTKDFAPDLPSEHPYRSEKMLYWVNCKEGSFQVRSSVHYSDVRGENMLSGEGYTFPTSQPPQYQEAAPGSVGNAIIGRRAQTRSDDLRPLHGV